MKEVLGVKLYTIDEVGRLLGVQRPTASKCTSAENTTFMPAARKRSTEITRHA